jgi:large subunit ribosomal protein L11
MQDLVEIAKMKKTDLLGKSLKEKAKEIAGTCVSMGVTIEGMSPKEIIKKIEEGEYEELFRED